MTLAGNIGLRDLLLAIVRDSDPMPISTDEIAQAAPSVTYTESCNCERWPGYITYRLRNPHTITAECAGSVHTIQRHQLGSEVYRHLRLIENRRLVERVHVDGARRVYWRLGAAYEPVEVSP